RAAGQETTGGTVRRHPAQTAEESGPRRPPASPGHPPQGTGHPAPQRQVRVVPATRPGASTPGPQAVRPRQTGTGPAGMGQPDGTHAAQDPHRVRSLPSADPQREASRDLHVIVTGEPDAPKGARPVRTGGRRKRTRTTGTSPAAYRCTGASPATTCWPATSGGSTPCTGTP